MKKAILEDWIPALITALIGGLMVAIITPSIQSNFASKTALADRKVKLFESFNLNMTCFISSYYQLVGIAQEEKKNRLSPQEILRKESYRQKRDDCGYQLKSDLILSGFYFGDDVGNVVAEYNKWMGKIENATIYTMPPRSDFESWHKKISNEILKKLVVK